MAEMAASTTYGSIPRQTPHDDEAASEDPDDPIKWWRAPATTRRGVLSFSFTTRGVVVWALLLGATGLVALLGMAYSNSRHVLDAERGSMHLGSRTRTINHKEFEEEIFFTEQLVDHFANNDTASSSSKYYAQRYFQDKSFFRGPGHAILVILGGEAPLDEGIIYPWVSRHLAADLQALTVCPEHRFYGASQPVAEATNEDYAHFLHPRQALADAARLIRHLQTSFGCGPRGTPSYCPVLTIGGSYPGFLSVLMRTQYADVVDMAWGSSAPLHLYSHLHHASDTAYYDKITAVAEVHAPGCSAAVKGTLTDWHASLATSHQTVEQAAAAAGICTDRIPAYIDTLDTLVQEVVMIIAARFADTNMLFYPPTVDQPFVQACHIFQQQTTEPCERVSALLRMSEGMHECFDLVSELPPGGTISASDWSGVGGGHSGLIWDFQSCTLIPECSLSPESMFPPRQWTLEWLTVHCQRRFDYTPHPQALVEEFSFDDLSQDSHIIFTNGFNDGWYVLSVTQDLSDTIRAFNYPNGSHHSDLTHYGATDQDTPDIVQGHEDVTALVRTWMDEIMLRNR